MNSLKCGWCGEESPQVDFAGDRDRYTKEPVCTDCVIANFPDESQEIECDSNAD